ncbi:oligosaccharide flippase family protein [Geotalea daltonii]|uniref:oligosaccharide flippase family protein n=1 Tax=Geotalea daltonii TaxID=1203471 RepID=UPI0012B5A4E3|nr:oligosaccharide flippase family protein [Geotalea daltonii]
MINSLFGFFGLALINPVGMYLNRKMHRWAEKKLVLNRFAIFNFFLLLLAILSSIIVFLVHRIGHVGGSISLPVLMLFLMLSIYFTAWNQTIIPTLNLLNHRLSFVVFTLLTLISGLGMAVLLVNFWAATAVSWLSGQLIAQALFALIALYHLRKVVGGTVDRSEMGQVIKRENLVHVLSFVFPLGITTFFMWLQNQSYRIVIEKTAGAEFLGLLGLGIGVASSIAAAFESLVQQLYLPLFYSEISTYDQERRTQAFNRMVQLTLPVYLSMTVLVSCLAPFLVNLLAHEKFSTAFQFVIFGAWMELFRVSTNVFGLVAQSEMQTRYLVKAYLTGGVIAVGGVYVAATHQYFQQTVPLILVASGLITTIVMYAQMKKLMRIKLGIRNVVKSLLVSLPFLLAILFYNQPRTMLSSLAILAVSGLYFLLTQYLICRPLLAQAQKAQEDTVSLRAGKAF